MPEAIPELIWFALLLFTFALVYVVRRFIEALFTPIIAAVGHVPLLGGALRGALVSVEQSISNALGSVENGIDALIGASWHRLAQLTDWLWKELKGHATLLATLAATLAGFGNVLAAIRALVHHTTHAGAGTSARVKTLERELHGIEHQVRTLERDVSKGIGHDVLPRLKSLDRELNRVENKTIPAIEAADAQASSAISDLWTWIHKTIPIPGTDAFTAAVAVALGLGVWNLFRCPTFLGKTLGRGCGLWNALEDVLGLLADAVIFADLCRIIPEATTLFGEFEAPLTDLISSAANAVCATQTDPAGTLPAPSLYLPASPSLALNLP